MNYQKYQFWFNAYNNAVTALSSRNFAGSLPDAISNSAKRIADAAVEEFEEPPAQPNPLEGIDLKSIVQEATASATGKKSKRK